MKQISAIIAFILVALSASAKEFTLPVGQFSKIQVDDDVNVIYVGGDGTPSRVKYEGDMKYAKAFIISQKGDKLRIQVETSFVEDSDLPTLYIYSDFLKQASLSSEATLKIDQAAPCSEISLSLMGNGTIVANNLKATKIAASIKTGNGTISIEGHCQTAKFSMYGSGTIQADRLEATEVDCNPIIGNGSIGCWPVNELKVRGIGTTKIYYKGNPEIDKKGGAKLFKMDWDEEGNK